MLSFVDTCTVSRQRSSAAWVTAVSGVADAKLPPMPTKTCTSPSRIAPIVSTVSRPSARGGSNPNSAANASRNAGMGRSQIPIVRSPCTFECPRTGHTPAPGRPMLPPRQQEVDHLANRRHRVGVLGEAHRPADDDALGGEDVRREPFGDVAGETGGAGEVLPVERPGVVGEAVEAVRVLLDEVDVEGVLAGR